MALISCYCKLCGHKTSRANLFATPDCRKCGGPLIRKENYLHKRFAKAREEIKEIYKQTGDDITCL